MSTAERIPAVLIESAAERLVSVPARSRRAAARQLIESAPVHGIDLSLIWGCVDRSRNVPRVTQACLIVPTPGRTAMVYLSGPDDSELAFDEQTQHQHRVWSLQAAFEAVDSEQAGSIRLLQALVAPTEPWAERACLEAGMRQIAELSYQKLTIPAQAPVAGELPEHVQVRLAGDMRDRACRQTLARALERSYIETLDCPELCGLRDIEDVIDSHRATGVHDPALWWVVFLNDEPEGALLLSPFPDQASVELVYLGFSPKLRGRGLGKVLMARAIASSMERGAMEMTCAVDMRNQRAIRLYRGLGFRSIDRRRALVRAAPGRARGV